MPSILHYCGHRLVPDGPGASFPERREGAVAAMVARKIAEIAPIAAYGSLASGADIIIAEAVVSAGGSLHIVLPFAAKRFIETSVASLGDPERNDLWIRRFDVLRRAAAELVVLAGDRDEEAAYAACSREAMTRALQHAAGLGLPALQLAIWNGQDAGGTAGTAADIRRWRDLGGKTVIIPADIAA
jgi:adenylate cyclase